MACLHKAHRRSEVHKCFHCSKQGGVCMEKKVQVRKGKFGLPSLDTRHNSQGNTSIISIINAGKQYFQTMRPKVPEVKSY